MTSCWPWTRRLTVWRGKIRKRRELVKMRFFAGLTDRGSRPATSAYRRATAKRHWAYARAWLRPRSPTVRDRDAPLRKHLAEIFSVSGRLHWRKCRIAICRGRHIAEDSTMADRQPNEERFSWRQSRCDSVETSGSLSRRGCGDDTQLRARVEASARDHANSAAFPGVLPMALAATIDHPASPNAPAPRSARTS